MHNVFGDNEDEIVNTLGGPGALSSDLLKKALPILAPLAMAFLAKSFSRQGGGAAEPGAAGDGGLGDVLGGLLGGGGGLGDVLGGLLGGG